MSSPKASDASSQKAIGWLLITGWGIILLNLPSGFLHFYLSSAVYVRDIAADLHLLACLIFLYRLGELKPVIRQWAILALVPLFLIPAVINYDYRFEALRTVKWSSLWLDWVILGHLAYLNRTWKPWLQGVLMITAGELVVEALVGLYEWHRGEYLFSTPWGEKTAFGILKVNDFRLVNHIRVRGLQRDVFSFANLMAMSATCGLIAASGIVKNNGGRTLGYLWAAFFAAMLVISGGRSALFGMFATFGLAIAYNVNLPVARKWSKAYVLTWVAIGATISLMGVGSLTESISKMVFGSSYLGNSASAYMRDDCWAGIIAAFNETPLILIVGGPFASLLDSRVAPMFHWADNQFLWDLYHLGLAGACAVAFYFFNVLRRAHSEVDPRAVDVVVFCLLLVIGEGIARESLTFMGCLPLFLSCGYVSAATRLSQAPSRGSSSATRRRRRVPPAGASSSRESSTSRSFLPES